MNMRWCKRMGDGRTESSNHRASRTAHTLPSPRITKKDARFSVSHSDNLAPQQRRWICHQRRVLQRRTQPNKENGPTESGWAVGYQVGTGEPRNQVGPGNLQQGLGPSLDAWVSPAPIPGHRPIIRLPHRLSSGPAGSPPFKQGSRRGRRDEDEWTTPARWMVV
jgi:hypothetical protein